VQFAWDGHAFEATGVFGYETDRKVQSVVVLGERAGQNITVHGEWALTQGFSVEVNVL
jgi:hypothetical protein